MTTAPRRRRRAVAVNGNGADATTEDPVAVVERMEEERRSLRAAGRAAMGVTGKKDDAPPLRRTLREHGVSWYPLIALSVLAIVDDFQRSAFLVLGPDISRSLGIGRGALGGLVALSYLMVSLAALPMAAFVEGKPRRALFSKATAFAWSGATLFTGFVRGLPSLGAILSFDGATTGSATSLHQPLLFDTYPPASRVRVLAFYRAANFVGQILAPALVAVATGLFFLTWRGVFLVMGVLSLAASLLALRLRDPGYGRWDTSRIRDAVQAKTGYHGEQVGEEDVQLRFFEVVRRLLLIPTVRRLLTAFALLGMMIVPLLTYISFFLEEEFGLTAAGRGVFDATTPILALVALRIAGPRFEALYRRDPAALMRRVALMFSGAVFALFLGLLSPVLIGAWLGFGAMYACFAAALPAITTALQGIIRPQMRPHALALTGVFLYGVGGPAGLILMSGIDRRFGLVGAIGVLAIPSVLSLVVLHRTSLTIDADLDRMVDDLVEEEELRDLVASGAHLPMLACRHIDFAYDQLQVLFDVSFTVDDGEMVALLGTNGAGKSTLLRVISGLGIPSGGSVRFRGADVTYLDPQRRVNLGISQIPGGKAVFPRLSVVENLRAYGYTMGRNRKAVDEGIETTFATFPRLHERRNQPAATLSGGEAQMLALSKALLLQPRLLLIDELSLGLAPKVVGELLELVRVINAKGTSVVLVEQSVNIALSLVDHAYFMEKGAIQFDGKAADLVHRDDLLRSVFLEGAARGNTR